MDESYFYHRRQIPGYCSDCRDYDKYCNCTDSDDENIYYTSRYESCEKIQERADRKKLLIQKLNEKRLSLRSDSTLCENYINYGDMDVDYVVHRMCQMKYLYDYCGAKAITDRLYHQRKHRNGVKLIDIAEKQILKKHKYPEIWPWCT